MNRPKSTFQDDPEFAIFPDPKSRQGSYGMSEEQPKNLRTEPE